MNVLLVHHLHLGYLYCTYLSKLMGYIYGFVSSISSNYVFPAATFVEDLAKEISNLVVIRDGVKDQILYPSCFNNFEKLLAKKGNLIATTNSIHDPPCYVSQETNDKDY